MTSYLYKFGNLCKNRLINVLTTKSRILYRNVKNAIIVIVTWSYCVALPTDNGLCDDHNQGIPYMTESNFTERNINISIYLMRWWLNIFYQWQIRSKNRFPAQSITYLHTCWVKLKYKSFHLTKWIWTELHSIHLLLLVHSLNDFEFAEF